MSTNRVVKLLRFDEEMKSNNLSVNPVFSNTTAEIDVSHQSIKVKQSSRLSRKCSFQDKSVIEDVDHTDNIKEKKCFTKKPQFTKTEPVKPIVPQKDSKKPKSQILNRVKLTENCSINGDFKKNNLVNDVDENDTSNEGENNEKLVPLKIHKSKIPKSNIPIKKRFSVKNDQRESRCEEDALSDNSVLLKLTKNKSSKSNNGKKSFLMKNTHGSNVLADFEEINDNLTPSKTLRSKSSAKSLIEKKLIMDNVKKNDVNIEVQEKSDTSVSKSSSLIKGQSLNTNVDNTCNNEIDLKQTIDMAVVLDKLSNVQKPKLTKGPNDHMMMLKSNNKTTKIKNKWSEKWSVDKLLNTVLKSNNDDYIGGLKIDLNNCSKTINKEMKTPKSKNTDYNTVKTNMLEELDENTNDSFSIKNLNASVHFDLSSTNIPGTQNQDHLLTTNSITLTEFITASNDVITEPDNNKIINDVSLFCADAKSISSSEAELEVTSESSTCTELSILPVEIPNIFSNSSNNAVKYKNYQSLNVINSESEFNTTSPSFPMGYTESDEISYGLSLLSEAIESAEGSGKTKSSKQDINEMQSSSKNTISSFRSQVSNTIISPQNVNQHSNESKVVDKYSEQIRAEREILLFSKRYNIPIEYLRKTVIEEPLSIFHKKYSQSITPNMITISPFAEDLKINIQSNTNNLNRNVGVEYKLELFREAAAYKKTNLKDLMEELTKTMPSWTLSIVTNPPRYLISHMSINKYGVPSANKVIVLDKLFRASVYINQSLEHTYCKPYTTAIEIVNLIKELNSI